VVLLPKRIEHDRRMLQAPGLSIPLLEQGTQRRTRRQGRDHVVIDLDEPQGLQGRKDLLGHHL